MPENKGTISFNYKPKELSLQSPSTYLSIQVYLGLWASGSNIIQINSTPYLRNLTNLDFSNKAIATYV